MLLGRKKQPAKCRTEKQVFPQKRVGWDSDKGGNKVQKILSKSSCGYKESIHQGSTEPDRGVRKNNLKKGGARGKCATTSTPSGGLGTAGSAHEGVRREMRVLKWKKSKMGVGLKSDSKDNSSLGITGKRRDDLIGAETE